MDAAVRQLFSELIDLPPAERDELLVRRQVPDSIREELVSLLEFDSTRDALTLRVGEAVEMALRSKLAISTCGPYRLIRQIGAGGMGTVFLAAREDGEIDQQVAIKLVHVDANRPSWRERFLRERQLLASLNHPSIARLVDAGRTSEGQPYLVMEFVEGVPIDEYAETQNLRGRLEIFSSVCEAVAHAHSHAIIHRDLKPSNILVDRSGNPKLLDFGIAKVLGATSDPTRTVERLLTPSYASPEQLRGDAQDITTDIYSLGAVLYKLLTGRTPHELLAAIASDLDDNVPAPSGLNRELPRDVDYVVLKALRFDPKQRYASVTALADDIQSLLDSRPVQARSGDTWYRLSKGVRRNRASVVSGSLIVAVLGIAAVAANHQRRVAANQSMQGRELAMRVLAMNEPAGDPHNPSKTRYELVNLSREYLEGLSAGARGDRALALELGRAYSSLARAQGITVAAVVGQPDKAEENLRKAAALVQPILSAEPDHRDALLSAARIGHDRMMAAETEHRASDTVARAQEAVTYLERWLAGRTPASSELETASEYFYDIAQVYKNLHRFEDGIRYIRRSVELSSSVTHGAMRKSVSLSLLADLLRLTGDLQPALETIRESRSLLAQASFASEQSKRSASVAVLWREAKILGATNGLSLNRPDEAIAVLQEAFDLVESWTEENEGGAWSRLGFASLGRELGEMLRDRNPQRALSVYDHSLARLREVPDNTEARRGEIVLSAASAYSLRRLGRVDEANGRIEGAFQLLRQIGEYPADRIPPHGSAELALRALGDHLAETGRAANAVKIFEDLIRGLDAAKLDPRNDLRHAASLTQLYGSLNTLYRRLGLTDEAKSVTERRAALWRDWGRKLPESPLVQHQLELAAAR